MARFVHGVFTQTIKLTGLRASAVSVDIEAQVRRPNDAKLELTRAEAETLHRELGVVLGKAGHA